MSEQQETQQTANAQQNNTGGEGQRCQRRNTGNLYTGTASIVWYRRENREQAMPP